MARRDDPDDIDALLREVDASLSGGAAAPRSGSGGTPATSRRGAASPAPAGAEPAAGRRPGGRVSSAARTALISALVAGAVVAVLFLTVLFRLQLNQWQAAGFGAFLATLVTVFAARVLRR